MTIVTENNRKIGHTRSQTHRSLGVKSQLKELGNKEVNKQRLYGFPDLSNLHFTNKSAQ